MMTFHKFWELISQLPGIKSDGDQTSLAMVVEECPNAIYRGVIPNVWNVHLGNGYRRDFHKLLHLTEKGQNMGILHFTDGVDETFFEELGLDKYCGEIRHGPRCKGHLKEYQSSWGLAEYYVKLPETCDVLWVEQNSE